MNHLSLFTGAGGFDRGFDRAGMTTIGQVENDKHCQTVLERHWPDIPRWGDIHDFTGRPGIDVLSGGFPCQDYSVAGKRGGLAGDRGALWWQLHRVASECRPTWIVGENVPGLLSSNGGQDFHTIVGSLVQLGYGVCWAVLDSQYFGVAQRRRRLFIVGHSGGEPRPEVLAISEGLFGYPPPRRETGQGVAAAVAGRSDPSSPIAGTVGSVTGGQRTTDLEGSNPASVVGYDEGGGSENWSEADPMGTLAAGSAASRHLAHLVLPFAQNTRDEVRIENDGTHVGALEAQPGMKQRSYLATPSTVRRLTVVECARLQGFPDDWNDHLSDTQRYRQFGNAVTVPVAEWVGRRIMEQEG